MTDHGHNSWPGIQCTSTFTFRKISIEGCVDGDNGERNRSPCTQRELKGNSCRKNVRLNERA